MIGILSSHERLEEVDRYADWLRSAHEPVYAEDLAQLGGAAANTIYGPVIASNLEHFRTQDAVEPRVASQAAKALCQLAQVSSEEYLLDLDGARPEGWYMSRNFITALKNTHGALATGHIRPLPGHFGMTPSESQIQAHTADSVLSDSGRVVAHTLTNAAHRIFPGSPEPLEAAHIPTGSLDELVESTEFNYLSPESRSNLAIGQFVRGFIERRRTDLHIVDIGSGTGNTLAAIVNGLSEVASAADYESVSLTAIESNKHNRQALTGFAYDAAEKIRQEALGFRLDTSADLNDGLHPGSLRLVGQDAAVALSSLSESEAGKPADSTVVLTANYSWHYLPYEAKQRMITNINRVTGNSIFLVADTLSNASEIERRFYNFGNGGLISCGNVGLRRLFSTLGYEVADIACANDAHVASRNLHPKLAASIQSGRQDNRRFWIAYRGTEAARLLASN